MFAGCTVLLAIYQLGRERTLKMAADLESRRLAARAT
jgi:hypothetical protein